MNPRWKRLLLRWDVLTLAVLLLYPVVCTLVGRAFPDDLGPKFGYWLGDKLSTILIFGILALALNVAVGYAGLLQLGIAAFFAIGANITGSSHDQFLSVSDRLYGRFGSGHAGRRAVGFGARRADR